jgi:ketosteroid isomerase-like protein
LKENGVSRDTIQRYWSSANRRDWAAFAALLDAEVLYEVPQTRERVRGREAYLEFNRTWPGAWVAEVRQIVADADSAVSHIDFHVDGEVMTGISFFALRDGLITKITDYWPEAYEPPARMTPVIERY